MTIRRVFSGIAQRTRLMVAVGVVAGSMVAASAAMATPSGAYRRGFDVWKFTDVLDHTYFCLHGGNSGNDCLTIVGWGSGSTNYDGAFVPGTSKDKSKHDRCLARSRASNSWKNACGVFSQMYGINGVCHQHTNRGQLSMHADWMYPGHIQGGWLSFTAYGPYGISYPLCFTWSQAQCAFTW